MKAEFEAIKNAWEAGDDESRATARSLADQYVTANPDEFDGFADMSIESLVGAVDTFRAAGAPAEDDRWRVETWLLHHFEPQQIGGVYQPQIRTVTTGG